MKSTHNIPDTEEAWDTGQLGRDAQFAKRDTEISDQDLDDGLGLKSISIRLEKSLIDDFKMIAHLNGMGYQPLMRQALKRFAECERKRIVKELYDERVAIEAQKKQEEQASMAEKKAA